eukprot:GHVT01050118.1.p1 GENE.GHVT01050118.1~~GHVT01050118.1.p1  ORF type:complete len:154 (+),score=13.45 GHVT01050118.1:405-866(+)
MGLIHSVPNDNVYIIETCGKFSGVAHAGFLCTPLPCIRGVKGKLSTRIRQLDVSVETKTRDNVFVFLNVSVQYAIQPAKVFQAHYSLQDHQAQIRSYVFDVVRAAVPQMDLDRVFESKDDVASAVKDSLKQTMVLSHLFQSDTRNASILCTLC